MSPEQREELELQASEYALGTLSGEERAHFEQALANEPWLQQRVDEWNRRLGPLAEALPPLAPSPALWQRIEASLGAPARQAPSAPTLWERIAFWRWMTLGAVAAAAALLLYVAIGPRGPVGDHVAVLNNAQNQPAVVVVADVAARTLTIRQLAAAPAGQAHELWLLPGAGEKPISLGVIAGATDRHQVSPALAAALPKASALAVSLEPAGGSPTGQPTGPVLYAGPLLALAR